MSLFFHAEKKLYVIHIQKSTSLGFGASSLDLYLQEFTRENWHEVNKSSLPFCFLFFYVIFNSQSFSFLLLSSINVAWKLVWCKFIQPESCYLNEVLFEDTEGGFTIDKVNIRLVNKKSGKLKHVVITGSCGFLFCLVVLLNRSCREFQWGSTLLRLDSTNLYRHGI